MNKKRLRHLVKLLEAIPPERLNMSTWFESGSYKNGPYGTVACAAGHACMDLQFQAQGLSLGGIAHITFDGQIYLASASPRFNDLTSWDALQAFFGLTFLQTYRVFSADAYKRPYEVTPADVAGRIRKLLDK